MSCSNCSMLRGPVPSYGPVPCRVLLLGECPSKAEDKYHTPLCGPTGEELDTVYITLTGLSRDHFHVANVRQCSFPDYHIPTNEDAITCANTHLSLLLNRVQPEIIVPMGAVACSIFPAINLNLHHGTLQPGKWGSWTGWIFPTFHPTVGMRITSYMIPLTSDFKRLGELLSMHKLEPLIDQYPIPDYRVIGCANDLYDYVDTVDSNSNSNSNNTGVVIAEDTESLPDSSPYCLTFSLIPGTGRLIYSHDTYLLDEYRYLLSSFPHTQIFHNYLHDITVLEQLQIPVQSFADTMVMAYHLCLGGGGDDESGGAGRGSLSLKVLAYRHLGITMTSFKDTVHRWSLPYLYHWLTQSHSILTPTTVEKLCICGHLSSHHSPRGKTQRHTGSCSLCECRKWKTAGKVNAAEEDKRLTMLYRKLGTVIGKIENGTVDTKTDAWKLAGNWPDYDLETLTAICGMMPRPSIADVPEPELLQYACRDADATLRLYYYLSGLKPWIYYE